MEPRTTSKRAAPAPKVVAVLAGLLERAARRGDADADAGGAGPGSGSSAGAAAFRGRAGKRPEIGVRRYAERIYRYAGCSPACFVVAYAYLDRLARRQGAGEGDAAAAAGVPVAVEVDSYSVHRLLITSVMVAAKFMDDIHYNNAYFARVGGVEVSEMNGLELEFLFALRFRLNVTPDEFASYCAALEGEITTTTAVEVAPPLFARYGRLSPEEVESQDQQPPQKDAVVARVTFTAAQRVAEITQ